MSNNNRKQINIRATDREASVIKRNAAKCGMSVSQFLILRGLGFEPQPLPPAVYYHFIEKLDNLQDHGIPAESKQQIRALTNDIRNVMIEMQKEDLKEWLSQVSGQ